MASPRRRRISVFLAFVTPAVLSAGLLVASAVPAQAIDIAANSQSPVPGEQEVARDADVRVTFDVPARGVTATTFTLERTVGGASVPATVMGDATNTTFRLNPNAILDGGVSYTARLSNTITDEGALPFAGASWEFTTTATPPANTAPTVTDRSPAAGATSVSPLVTVSATFSEEVLGVNEATFTLERTSTGVEVPAVVFRRGTTNRWSLNPDNPLVDNALYTVRLTGGPGAIRDLAGTPLVDDSWSFDTGAGADTVAPRVLSRFPRPGSTGVNRLTDVQVRFSEAVRRVNDVTFTLTNTRTGDEVLATVSRLGSSRQWVLEPDRVLRRGTRYVARLSGGVAGIQDLGGNALRSVTWSFRTRF
jgi:hypothetical protein